MGEAAQGRGAKRERGCGAGRPAAAAKPIRSRTPPSRSWRKPTRRRARTALLSAEARQIYYAARPEIMRLAEVDTLDSGWFTQEFLVDYMNDHPDECATWKSHFRIAATSASPTRGGTSVSELWRFDMSMATPNRAFRRRFCRPEIERVVPKGATAAALYREGRLRAALDQAKIAERFDLAIMSCKGMSVTAARELSIETCARFNIPLYILHDFDISGFSIAATLHQSNRRYQFDTASGADFKVVDFGLRLEDVERLGLTSEPVSLGKISKDAWRERLKINGATDREIEFLLTGPALTSVSVSN